MEKPLYFAYGSNINLDQMRYRCPDASWKTAWTTALQRPLS